jgi:drug/metabolite transporter (DMT)-like permease
MKVSEDVTPTDPRGVTASAMAAILWGFGGVFAVLVSSPSLVLSFYRLWVGAVLLIVILYVSRRRLSLSALRASWLAGLLLGGDLVMFYSAIKLTSVVDATVIGALQPVIVILLARPLFGERLRKWDWAWVAVAVIGVLIAVIGAGSSGHHQLSGDLFAIGALLCWSAYWLVSKRARVEQGAMEYTACVTIVAAVAVTPIVLLSSQSLGDVRAGDWLWIGLLVIVPGGGHLLMNWAHRFVDASISSVISCLSPLVAALAAKVILSQPLTLVQLGGVLLGLAAIAVISVQHNEPVAPPLE